MRLLCLGKTEIRCDPFCFLLLPVLLALGAVSSLLTALLSLTLHELSHTMCAHALGYTIGSVEIQPFGFVARMTSRFHSALSELLIAAAGPLCSLILAMAFAGILYFFPALEAGLAPFLSFNLILGLMNLLPALPLDGGRILRALLCMVMRPRSATLVAAWLGIGLGAAMGLLGVLAFSTTQNLTLPLMGLFLLLAAIRELCGLSSVQLDAMMRRSKALRQGESLILRQIVLYGGQTGEAALKHLASSRYNLVLVVDDSMRVLGLMDEGTLLETIAEKGTQATLFELLTKGEKHAAHI